MKSQQNQELALIKHFRGLQGRMSSKWMQHLYLHVYLPNSFAKLFFNGTWYLNQYPDVKRAGVDPWLHYNEMAS